MRGDIAVIADFIFACGAHSGPSHSGGAISTTALLDNPTLQMHCCHARLALMTLKALAHTCV